MALSLLERETIINYNDAEQTANIYTASPVVLKKLQKLGKVREANGGWEIDVPKSWIVVRPPAKRNEAQRKAAAENIKKARLSQKNVAASQE